MPTITSPSPSHMGSLNLQKLHCYHDRIAMLRFVWTGVWCTREIGRPEHWAAGLVRYLFREACVSLHDEGPEPMTAGQRGDEQSLLLALFEELLQAGEVHMLVAALFQVLVRRLIIDSDPLHNTRAQAALSLGAVAASMEVAACPSAPPNALYPIIVTTTREATRSPGPQGVHVGV